MKKIHLSIDDVIYSYVDLCKDMPTSIFDNSFFDYLKELHNKYNAQFTLYSFENYKSNFSVKNIPKKYWDELIEADFCRFGYHGCQKNSEPSTFINECCEFYASIPEKLRAERVRLHRYAGDITQINLLKEFGVKELLCREKESRNLSNFPMSYTLSEQEENSLYSHVLTKDGIFFRKTDIRLEFYDEKSLRTELTTIINDGFSDEIIIFTHEKEFYLKNKLCEAALRILSEYDVKFVF